jgi:hypothetical protein
MSSNKKKPLGNVNKTISNPPKKIKGQHEDINAK